MKKTYIEIRKEKSRQTISFRRFITLKSLSKNISKYFGKGVDVGFLREWIKEKFIDEMSWENYGKIWEIDHIVPFRVFDIFNETDLFLCWNYRNLMPLLCADNLKKQGNIFFSFELLSEYKNLDTTYAQLYNKIRPEVEWMIKYIDNYNNKKWKE